MYNLTLPREGQGWKEKEKAKNGNDFNSHLLYYLQIVSAVSEKLRELLLTVQKIFLGDDTLLDQKPDTALF